MMISTALTLLSALGSMVGTGVGAKLSSDKNKQAIKGLERQHTNNQEEYNKMYSSDFLSRPDTMNLMNRRKELASQQYARARKVASNFGGTTAMLDAENANNNNWINQAYSTIGANATAFKDNVKARQMADNTNYANQKANILQNQANGIAQSASGISSAMAGIASVANQYGNKKIANGKTDEA